MGIIATDFDTTLHSGGFPNIPLLSLLKEKSRDHQIVLWTCNFNTDFIDRWMDTYGLRLDGYNTFPGEKTQGPWPASYRKMPADVYIDDRAVNPHEGIDKVRDFLRVNGIP